MSVFANPPLFGDTSIVSVMAAPLSTSPRPLLLSLFPSSSPAIKLPLRPAPHRIAHDLSFQARLPLQSFPSQLLRSIHCLVTRLADHPALRRASILGFNAIATSLPAIAEEEKGKIFDFNLTLPIMAVQFLLLMVLLDNLWFKPVGKVMDERDEFIRQKLLGVRDNSGEIKKLQEEAEAILKAARAETTAALNKMKRETAAELDAKLKESRERIEKELAIALANLEIQKQETLKSLDKQVQELSEEIIRKVIPFEV